MMTPIPPQKYQAVQDWLLRALEFETELLGLFDQFRTSDVGIENYIELTSQLTEKLKTHYAEVNQRSNYEQWNNLGELHQLLSVFPNKQTELQTRDRFYPVEGDSFGLKLRKLFKRICLKTGWLGIRTANLFRKTPEKTDYWEHDIQEAALADYVFVGLFAARFSTFIRDLLERWQNRVLQFYEIDRILELVMLLQQDEKGLAIRFEQLAEAVSAEKRTIQRFFADTEQDLDLVFAGLYLKAGTIEFPDRRLEPARVERQKQRAFRATEHSFQNSFRAVFAIAEHWRLKLYNRSLIFKLKSQAGELQGEIQQQISDILRPAFIELKKELAEFASRDAAEWKDSRQVLAIKTYIREQIPRFVQLVFQSKLSSLFERPMSELEQAIKTGPEKHLFAAAVFDGKPVPARSFHPVATRSLLNGIVLKGLRDQFAAERKKFGSLVQRLSVNLDEIQQTANYSVDFYFDQRQNLDVSGELNEGMKRTVKKADEILSVLAEIQTSTAEAFSALSDSFTQKILQYFEPHQLQQSVRINQRRARVEKLKQILRDSITALGHYAVKGWGLAKVLYHKLYSRYFSLRSLLGIGTDKAPISTELSNYLSETKLAISRLPLMYQKLFENVPLNEERFYLPRRVDLQHLDEAFASWKNGNFAPVCMVGEQGCGTTTLFNFFQKQLEQEFLVARFELRENKVNEAEMVSFLSEGFPGLTFATIDEFITAVNQLEHQQVVFIENIHNLFLRANGAYENLYRLFRLISQTNRKVFWVTSCFEYSWKLLDYTTDISGYFAHVVYFSPLTAANLREAIMKRHQVSGFSLQLLEPYNFNPKRNYQRLGNDEKQNFLLDLFFEALWQYAQSNMKLAFIFWLRAIRKVEDGVISIQAKQLNFDFLNSLRTNEITSLHSILIHGGLRRHELARLFRWDEKEANLMLMSLADDGLVEEEGQIFTINPLIYRMLIGQLKSLNFIY